LGLYVRNPKKTIKLSANDSEHDKDSNELGYYEEQEEESDETTVNQVF
jgi:hypothetical protein